MAPPVVGSVLEPVLEPVVGPVLESVLEPVLGPVLDPLLDPVLVASEVGLPVLPVVEALASVVVLAVSPLSGLHAGRERVITPRRI